MPTREEKHTTESPPLIKKRKIEIIPENSFNGHESVFGRLEKTNNPREETVIVLPSCSEKGINTYDLEEIVEPETRARNKTERYDSDKVRKTLMSSRLSLTKKQASLYAVDSFKSKRERFYEKLRLVSDIPQKNVYSTLPPVLTSEIKGKNESTSSAQKKVIVTEEKNNCLFGSQKNTEKKTESTLDPTLFKSPEPKNFSFSQNPGANAAKNMFSSSYSADAEKNQPKSLFAPESNLSNQPTTTNIAKSSEISTIFKQNAPTNDSQSKESNIKSNLSESQPKESSLFGKNSTPSCLFSSEMTAPPNSSGQNPLLGDNTSSSMPKSGLFSSNPPTNQTGLFSSNPAVSSTNLFGLNSGQTINTPIKSDTKSSLFAPTASNSSSQSSLFPPSPSTTNAPSSLFGAISASSNIANSVSMASSFTSGLSTSGGLFGKKPEENLITNASLFPNNPTQSLNSTLSPPQLSNSSSTFGNSQSNPGNSTLFSNNSTANPPPPLSSEGSSLFKTTTPIMNNPNTSASLFSASKSNPDNPGSLFGGSSFGTSPFAGFGTGNNENQGNKIPITTTGNTGIGFNQGSRPLFGFNPGSISSENKFPTNSSNPVMESTQEIPTTEKKITQPEGSLFNISSSLFMPSNPTPANLFKK